MKKLKNRLIIVMGIVLITILAATAIFAAGQYFQVLPHPEYIGLGCTLGIVLLIIGMIIGMNINNDHHTD